MKAPPAYGRLLTELAALHDQALRHPDDTVQPEPTAVCERRLQSIRIAARQAAAMRQTNPSNPYARIRGRSFRRAPSLIAFAVATLGLLATLGMFLWQSRSRVIIAPDGAAATWRSTPSAFSVATADVEVDPCIGHVRADGSHPLIDDFEDANPLVAPNEGRLGLWGLYRDDVALGTSSPLLPSLRPRPLGTNRYALHATGGELRDWGAVVQIAFLPACYDASVYAGVGFSAMGPGRLYVGVREVRVVPTKWGGTCKSDCYNTHQKKIELTGQWQHFTVKWPELRQRGYNTPALDPSRTNSIAFSIQPADTPFDIWLDDVHFIHHF
jgi:hypothetical protein